MNFCRSVKDSRVGNTKQKEKKNAPRIVDEFEFVLTIVPFLGNYVPRMVNPSESGLIFFLDNSLTCDE